MVAQLPMHGGSGTNLFSVNQSTDQLGYPAKEESVMYGRKQSVNKNGDKSH